MKECILIVVGVLNMFVVVGCGVFGVYGLKKMIFEEMLVIWYIVVIY